MALTTIIALPLIVTFLTLSLWHVYWLLGGRVGLDATIPEVDGKPVFQPSAAATFVVAVVLALCALLLAATAGLVSLPLPNMLLTWLTRGLAAVLLLRAIGDFRLVGFFKRIQDTRFARLDTAVYSPLCLLLAIGSSIVGFAS
ncbi:MAG: DUF3995 domain-containing protein [Nitrospira sp.]|nr:DUF3995 domain-containing protein [Nitrospira sp.]